MNKHPIFDKICKDGSCANIECDDCIKESPNGDVEGEAGGYCHQLDPKICIGSVDDPYYAKSAIKYWKDYYDHFAHITSPNREE